MLKTLTLTIPHLLGSRAVIDKIQMSNTLYPKFERRMKDVESWVGLFQTLDVTEPKTWVTTGVNFIKRISVPEKLQHPPMKSLVSRFTEKLKLVKVDQLSVLPFYQDLAHKYIRNAEELHRNDDGILYLLPLEGHPENFYFFEVSEPVVRKGREYDVIPFLPDYFEEPERRRALNKKLSELFWKDHKVLRLHASSDKMDYARAQYPERQYEGELTELYDNLQKYYDQGIRRAVLLQGPPGTGKSTLALNLAERLSSRTLVITHNTLSWCDSDSWFYYLDMFQPEMIIVDDIDRISSELSRKLFLFEESRCEVPYIILTSNNFHTLPDAFKRPGRIDQIIEMTSPPKSVLRKVLLKIAEMEGVEVPEEKIAILGEIHETYTGAYLVELLRRAKAEGWNFKIKDYDLTFADLSEDLKRRWNRDLEIPKAEDLTLDDFDK